MKLICYTLDGKEVDVKPASSERRWMNETRVQFAKRCLPLVVANSNGWQINALDGCWIKWNGGIYAKDLKIKTDTGTADHIASHFGHGILTFKVHCLFRTEPGINLWVSGPTNQFKDGIQAMNGLLETDWMPYTFTMNWQVTRKRKWIRFEKGEPIAQVFPVPRGMVDNSDPVMQPLNSDAELNEIVTAWHKSRTDFNNALAERDVEASKQGWQKHYFRGVFPDGSPGSTEHQTKIKPKPFRIG
jgi:hypothetical protein